MASPLTNWTPAPKRYPSGRPAISMAKILSGVSPPMMVAITRAIVNSGASYAGSVMRSLTVMTLLTVVTTSMTSSSTADGRS